MLPMNKLVEDVDAFMKEREKQKGVVVKTEETLKNEVVLFANELSEKHNELVSVKLVRSLIVTYNDAMDKAKDDKESTLSSKNPVIDLMENIDDGIDLNEED